MFTSLHAHATDPSQSYLLQRFINGSECEVSGRNRTTGASPWLQAWQYMPSNTAATDVKIYCTKDLTDSTSVQGVNLFGEVSEVSICHYEVRFSTSLICDHPAFQAANVPDINVECVPEDENGQPLQPPEPDTSSQQLEARMFKELTTPREPPQQQQKNKQPSRTKRDTGEAKATPPTGRARTSGPTTPGTARGDSRRPDQPKHAAPSPRTRAKPSAKPTATASVSTDGAVAFDEQQPPRHTDDPRVSKGATAQLEAKHLERMRQRHLELEREAAKSQAEVQARARRRLDKGPVPGTPKPSRKSKEAEDKRQQHQSPSPSHKRRPRGKFGNKNKGKAGKRQTPKARAKSRKTQRPQAA